MVVEQFAFYKLNEVDSIITLGKLVNSQVIFLFGSKEFICNKEVFNKIKITYPNADIIGCTTAGEIFNDQVNDNILTVTAVYFESTEIKFLVTELTDFNKCYEKGIEIAKAIPVENLSHVFLIGEGININGSKLVEGVVDGLPEKVKVTGGLAGDYEGYKETFVVANDYGKKNLIATIAFYGEKIKIGFGSVGGFDTFGIERRVTKSKDNILYELDGKPALDLYKEYLGEYASRLPVSGLLFPLNIRSRDNKYSYVRTVAGIDEKTNSLRFAGEIPEGYYGKLMRANFNNLINGSIKAAENSITSINCEDIKLAILVSCRGRRVVLNQIIDEELEGVRSILGNDVIFTGFYSNGEIAPSNKNNVTEFHNQTMTITLIGEK
ncbi:MULTISPECIES: FIST signal transduction protein [Clostridium]|uniref:Uncharacterized protein n=1 Tax=Clostridium beijerinckii TaxID=1520 RepID=A0A1B9BKT0_CLOBE|nr:MULTISPECIES: FIST N-terminal domain-containing protein [Clostridium]AQS06231.1 FIST N domain protein [Clostridium beijerinckii]MBA2886269.1 hypothetical protein [Clostridium beijerinckii]MBA2900873.1 hypothetical protein [Clostridium beijerinckii]MBA2910828.1 hypothetical protein [Clostridium beijerinckii]MBA9014159.1 hypothetical protein [Clostridium beijerinckii]